MKCIKKLHILHLPLWFTFFSLIFTLIFTCLTQWNYEPCCVWPPKLDRSWWRVLMKHWRREWQTISSIIALRTSCAKSLQSCPTLCDPIDGSPPGSPVPGILQARTLEWVAISFSNAWKWKVKGKSLSHVRLLATPWTAAYQAPPSMGFSRQEYWSGVPLPSPWEPHEQYEKAKRYDGQGSLVCCSPWDHKESDTTEWLNWTYISKTLFHIDYKHNLCEIYLYFTYILHTYIYNYL